MHFEGSWLNNLGWPDQVTSQPKHTRSDQSVELVYYK